jgi:hypothetical protein
VFVFRSPKACSISCATAARSATFPTSSSRNFSWPRFLAIQIWLMVLFLVYVTAHELNTLFGDGELPRLFLRWHSSEAKLTRRQRIRLLTRLNKLTKDNSGRRHQRARLARAHRAGRHPALRLAAARWNACVPQAADLPTMKKRRTPRSPEARRQRRRCTDAASRSIDARIAELGDWRGETLARVRAIINDGRSGRRRGMEVGRAGVVARRHPLHRRDVQEGREADLRQGRVAGRPAGLFNSSLDGNTRRASTSTKATRSTRRR